MLMKLPKWQIEVRNTHRKEFFTLDQDIQDIKEVRELHDPIEVSRLLSEGWVMNFISHEPSRSRYVLVKFK